MINLLNEKHAKQCVLVLMVEIYATESYCKWDKGDYDTAPYYEWDYEILSVKTSFQDVLSFVENSSLLHELVYHKFVGQTGRLEAEFEFDCVFFEREKTILLPDNTLICLADIEVPDLSCDNEIYAIF